MPTTKKRLNITLEPYVRSAIAKIAKKDKVPEATKAAELLGIALELEEDLFFSALAEKRDVPGAKYISHKEFWKKALRKK